MAEYVNIHTHRPAGRGIELRAKGVHPWDAEREDTATLGQRLGDAQAVGETGLDFACGVAREAQTAALRAQLRLAHPDMTLRELSGRLGLTRSGVNHRLQRLLRLGEKILEEKGVDNLL